MLTSMSSAEDAPGTSSATKRARVTRGEAAREAEEKAREAEEKAAKRAAKKTQAPSRKSARFSSGSVAP